LLAKSLGVKRRDIRALVEADKGWITFLRIYGPQQPIFDDTRVLPDNEPIK
jgi:hypothetical protein